jgi:hypothetical protein
MGLIVLLAPLVTFLSLAFLPQGKAGRIGIASAALILGLVWWRADAGASEGALALLLSLFLAAVAAAAVLQFLRPALPADQPRAYPVLVGLVALAGLTWTLTR